MGGATDPCVVRGIESVSPRFDVKTIFEDVLFILPMLTKFLIKYEFVLKIDLIQLIPQLHKFSKRIRIR